MNQAVLTREECEALATFVNSRLQDVPEESISDALRSAAAKIEAVVSGPGPGGSAESAAVQA